MLKMYTTKNIIISYVTKNYTINMWTTPISVELLNPYHFIQVMYGSMSSHAVKFRFHFHTEVESWIGSGNPILPETYPTWDKRVELTIFYFDAHRIQDRLTLNASGWVFFNSFGTSSGWLDFKTDIKDVVYFSVIASKYGLISSILISFLILYQLFHLKYYDIINQLTV